MEWIIFMVIGVLGALFGIGVLAALSGNVRCSVCGVPLKRKTYTWTLNGKTQKVCPKCNSRMENKVSKDAFKSKFG
jgi:hypothetical protein